MASLDNRVRRDEPAGGAPVTRGRCAESSTALGVGVSLGTAVWLRAAHPLRAVRSFFAGLRLVAVPVAAALACSPASPPPADPSTPPGAEPGASGGEEWGESPPRASEAGSNGQGPSGPEPISDAPPTDSDDGLDADIAALSASTQATPTTPPSSAATPAPAGELTGGREIVYRVTPKGLVIEIDGIHLRAEAKPFKDASGAYGIQIVVNAESFDGRQYWVNKPKEGPLSIAGKLESQGRSSRFVDEREGNAEEPVVEGSPRRFEQRWPGRGQPKLWAGQTVTLEVGLWGVRAESGRQRPVRRLFVVKMVAGPRSQAVITPPTMDWGT
jgi:hypothetical protein